MLKKHISRISQLNGWVSIGLIITIIGIVLWATATTSHSIPTDEEIIALITIICGLVILSLSGIFWSMKNRLFPMNLIMANKKLTLQYGAAITILTVITIILTK